MIIFALNAVLALAVSVLLIAIPTRVNAVLDSVQHKVLGEGRGVMLHDGLLRMFGLLGLLLSTIFMAALIGWLVYELS